MRCAKCGNVLPAKHANAMGACPRCSGPLLHTTQELLSTPALGVVREIRPSQIEYGKTVELALQGPGRPHTIFAEAGCGIGKTYGYCVPALLRRQRFIIATGKKNLQDQLDSNDVPRLNKQLSIGATIVSLKGRGNYLCRKALNHMKKTFFAEGPKQEKYWLALDAWLTKDPIGDVSRMPFRFDDLAKQCTATDCLGKRCSKASGCGFIQQRLAARTADVIIVNHSLLGFDLKYAELQRKRLLDLANKPHSGVSEDDDCLTLGGGPLFGPYDLLVVDEAHLVVDFLRGAFSEEVRPSWLRSFLKKLQRDQIEIPSATEKAATQAWDNLFDYVQKLGTNRGPGAEPLPAGFLYDEHTDTDHVEVAGDELSTIRDAMQENVFERWGSKMSAKNFSAETIEALASRLKDDDLDTLEIIRRRHERIGEVVAVLKATTTDDDNVLNCLEQTGKGEYLIKRVPVNIAPYVSTPLSRIAKKVFTSATLPADLVSAELGVTPHTTITMPAEFDFEHNALLYLPRHLPRPVGPTDPGFAGYCDLLTQEIVHLVRLSRGNALVLFTARTTMEECARLVQTDYELEYPLYGQFGDIAAQTAMDQYMKKEGSVLFGLKSFFEGVDIQGDKLRLVILTKIPFPAPNELTKAKERILDKRYWTKFYFPTMLNDVRQAMGRLIRSQTDRGVAAILDPRVWVAGDAKKDPRKVGTEEWKSKNGYGHRIFRALPFSTWADDIYYVQQFFDNIFDEE